jgi:hypothetical protein
MALLSDPLAQFRQQPKTLLKTGKKPYEAYDKKGRPAPYTEILCISQPSQSPQSRFFLTAIFSADFDDALTLIYRFMAVEIKGKHLEEIAEVPEPSDPRGNRYDLYLLLQRLKAGSMSFEQFLTQAKC